MPVFSQVLLLLLVGLAAACDLASRRIPNVLVGAGLLLAPMLHFTACGPLAPLQQGLAGALAGGAIFLPFYLLRGMAAGDVKLMAMVGAFMGPANAVLAAILTCLAGGVLAMAMLIGARCAGRRAESMPYAVAIAVGTACAVAATQS
jgi:prepilin peptidase CpaA